MRDYLPYLPFLAYLLTLCPASAADRPNILWITAEDMSANLGCYGDSFARTPHIDTLARESVRYTRAFAAAPVCSPSRATLITGVYASSLGNPHLRCEVSLPGAIRGYGALLRDARYFTSNNVKTDYNLRDEGTFIRDCWDRCDGQSHWRQRAAGQPFMAVFNLMETHQSRTSVWPEEQFEREIAARLPPAERADPARVPLPPFYPDTPLARRAMARYYDCIAVMDQRVGEILGELAADGLADDTIVFFYSDHGMGMPRGKRLLYDSGLHVPLLVRFPEKWKHLAPGAAGSVVDRLVSFVDFAPTVLSLTGVPIPAHMQGIPFLGSAAGKERTFVVGIRDRVDEVYDTARSVRDKRWLYIRNYHPELSWAPPEGYSDQSLFRRELLALAHAGNAGTGPTAWLAAMRPVEELYDTVADPHQLRNLASESAHRQTLHRLRAELRQWLEETRDLGFVPEGDLLARCGPEAPYSVVSDSGRIPLDRIHAAADRAGRSGHVDELRGLLGDPDPAVRYWGAVGFHANPVLIRSAQPTVERGLGDSAASVRIESAAALLAEGNHLEAMAVLLTEMDRPDPHRSLQALRTLQLLERRDGSLEERFRGLLNSVRPREGDDPFALYQRFVLEALLDRGPMR